MNELWDLGRLTSLVVLGLFPHLQNGAHYIIVKTTENASKASNSVPDRQSELHKMEAIKSRYGFRTICSAIISF